MVNLYLAYLGMMGIVALSNYLVLFPINAWLTWAAFSYPISFLVTELVNRFYGPKIARKAVYVGFALGVVLSAWLAPIKIAVASGSAFFASQLLDIYVFNRLGQAPWWHAPFYASLIASVIDTAIFWSIAFLGEDVPILTWATGDFLIKSSMDIILLTPFRLAIRRLPTTA
jgi:queuosine precursor transporter